MVFVSPRIISSIAEEKIPPRPGQEQEESEMEQQEQMQEKQEG